MNQASHNMSATISPFLSGTSSPVPGGSAGTFQPQGHNSGPSSSQISTSMAMAAAIQAAQSGQPSPALAYANAQLSQYAQQSQFANQMPRTASGGFLAGPGQQPMMPPQQQQQQQQQQPPPPGMYPDNPNINQQLMNLFSQQNNLPPHLHQHALSTALVDYNPQSMPNSAASSPGQQYRRLPGVASGYPSGTMTGHNTPGGNSRVAASAITGKRLNWSEMICQTIAESESGRLVIQDLFENMCSKFPEIHEWAFGKDWEARVKNRIKSTLSIKGNLFIKVPRPSSASGKGSWWTLSQEAQDAWKEGRVASVVKNGTHSRNSSQNRGGLDGLAMSAATSRANSRGPSRRGSPVSSRGPSSQHAQHSNQHGQQRSSQNFVNFGQDVQRSPGQMTSSSSGSAGGGSDSRRQSPSAGLPACLGMSPINFHMQPSMDGMNFGMTGLDSFDDPGGPDPATRRMNMMENKVNDTFDTKASATENSTGASSSMGMSTLSTPTSNLYDMSPFNSFSQSGAPSQFGGLGAAAHMGGPQSMPFPPGSMPGTTGAPTSSAPDNYMNQAQNPNSVGNFSGDPTLGAFAGLDLSGIDGLNNPFGSMAGGYTMLGGEHSGAQPTPIPGRNGANGINSNSGSGGRGTPSASSFNANFLSGPSPADSTGSTSQFFAYTPAMNAADAAVGNTFSGSMGGSNGGGGGGGSALGPIGGEGSRKRRDTTGPPQVGDFQLPPAAERGSSGTNTGNANPERR